MIHFAAENGDWGGKPTIHEAPFEEFLRDSSEFEILEFSENRSTLIRHIESFSMRDVVAPTYRTKPVATATLASVIYNVIKNLKYHLYTRDETVERAREVARQCPTEGKNFNVFLNGHKYNLVFNNCEHFAIWCKTGVHESKQVDAVIKALVLTSKGYVVY